MIGVVARGEQDRTYEVRTKEDSPNGWGISQAYRVEDVLTREHVKPPIRVEAFLIRAYNKGLAYTRDHPIPDVTDLKTSRV